MELNIEQILESERAWEYVLLDIVRSEEIDPWDIDLTKLTAKYLERIKKMEQLDLRVPARLILAAAVLLRLQSDQLLDEDEEEAIEEMMLGEDLGLFEAPETEEDVELPMLDLRIRRKPQRKITLEDLITTLKKSLKPKEPRQTYKKTPFVMDFPEVDITEQIEKLYKQILGSDKKKMKFTELSPSLEREDIVDTLIPLLHLSNDHKINMDQEEFFHEIYVSKLKEKKKSDSHN
jgi:segregation and condensation protein A